MGFDPISMIMIGSTVASTMLGAAGTISSANAAKAQGAYQAQVLNNQALVAEQNAKYADQDAARAYEFAEQAGYRGQVRAKDQDRYAEEQIGAARARQSGSGLTGGSHQQVISSLEALAGQDRERIALEGAERSRQFRDQGYGFETEAADLRSGVRTARADARMARANASQAQTAGYLSAAGQVIGGVGDVGRTLMTGGADPQRNRTWSRKNYYKMSRYDSASGQNLP